MAVGVARAGSLPPPMAGGMGSLMGQYDDFSLRPPHGRKRELTNPMRLRPRILGLHFSAMH
eukprot:13549641-Alexandrium_andersonii.AAC.1